MYDKSDAYETRRIHMGWLRLVSSLKSYVSFAEYRLFSRALLQKRLIILRSLLIVATPFDASVCKHIKCIHCSTLQHTATHCNILQHSVSNVCRISQLYAKCLKCMQNVSNVCRISRMYAEFLECIHCSTLQHSISNVCRISHAYI